MLNGVQTLILYGVTYMIAAGFITICSSGDYLTRLVVSTLGAALWLAFVIGFGLLLESSHLLAFAALTTVTAYCLFIRLLYLVSLKEKQK